MFYHSIFGYLRAENTLNSNQAVFVQCTLYLGTLAFTYWSMDVQMTGLQTPTPNPYFSSTRILLHK